MYIPGAGRDLWYEPTYTHVNSAVGCDVGCGRDISPVIQRQRRSLDLNELVVHYGIIAFADRLMKDAVARG